MVGKGYERTETELEPGDELLFFTDGLLEVTIDPEGTQLGRSGLAGLFDAISKARTDDLLAALFAEVARFDVTGEADDDRTAVLMTIR